MTKETLEFDFRNYLSVLIQHRRFIVAIVLISALLAGIISLLLPRFYESNATLLVLRSRAQLKLTDQFQTVNDPLDARLRLDAMKAIATDDSLVLQVIQRLGNQLPAKQHDLKEFKSHADLKGQGDLLVITAKADNPQLASTIANTWANEAVAAVNSA